MLTYIVVFLLIMVGCAAAQEASAGSDTWTIYQKELLDQQKELALKEKQALEARKQAEHAYNYAVRIEDHPAVSVAERAIEKARQALERIHVKRMRVTERLEAVNKARTGRSDGKAAVASRLYGTVQIKTSQGWTALPPGALLKPGQQIRTGDASKAEVLFSDGTQVNLHANTVFMLESDDGRLSSYRLTLGRIKAYFRKYAQRRFRVRTPDAAIGVRGTEFLVETTADRGTALVVLKGEVEFGSTDGEHMVVVRQGELAMQSVNGLLRGPESIDLKILQPWWED